MKAKIQIANKSINGALQLSGSKSISNRLLILQALAGRESALGNLSNSEDTDALLKALSSKSSIIDIGAAGTAMRFLTAYLAVRDVEVVLTGAKRMKERPIKDLVDALRSLGAEINYLEKEGYPPLKIIGKKLIGGKISVNATISSQFTSALLMIAPYLEKGLQLELVGEIVSKPYIEMTLNLMQKQGVAYTWEGNTISILPGTYQNNISQVESDWSSISYIYELVALSESGCVSLREVDERSIQGDQKVMEYFQSFGVLSEIKKGVLSIQKIPDFEQKKYVEFDCVSTPDLAQTLAATACALAVRTKITGLNNLPLKETNRLVALQNELEKCGAMVKIINNEALEIYPSEELNSEALNFDTYEDHRMAMCLAPLALKLQSVTIENPQVVNKSYKSYWEDLKSLSFDIHLF